MKTMQLARTWSFAAVLAVMASGAPLLAYPPASGFSGPGDGKFVIRNPTIRMVKLDRLPKNVIPTHYKIDLDLTEFNVNSMPLESSTEFIGWVSVAVEFLGNDCSRSNRAQSKPDRRGPYKDKHLFDRVANKIVMHASLSLEIMRVGVYTIDSHGAGKPQEKLNIKNTYRGDQLIVLDMEEDLPECRMGVVLFEYRGHTQPKLQGLFVTSLNDRATVYPQLVAKFRPAFARLVLPCFDEPSFKANFSLTLRHRSRFRALANTDVIEGKNQGQVMVSTFEETPVMPIHMVAFTLAEYEPFPFTRNVRDDLKLRIFTPPGYADQGGQALRAAAKAIVWFEKFIDISFPLKKLDLVAIGDMDTDNTEAWGLAFVKHNLLLLDEACSMPDSVTRMALNVAHVVVHQWFGGLITAEWWSELWITEMVAAHMAFQFVAEKYPFYHSECFVRLALLSEALSHDKLSSGHFLSPSSDQLASPDGFLSIFDNVTFMKSAALARLLQNTLGLEKFHAALKLFAKHNHYGNVNAHHLVRALSNLNSYMENELVQDIVDTWIKTDTHVVINVDLTQETYVKKLYMYQEKIGWASKIWNSSQKFKHFSIYLVMPIEILQSDAKGNQQNTIKEIFYPGRHGIVYVINDWSTENEPYLKVNPNPDLSTYYRIRYSDGLLQRLHAPIKSKQISPMGRLQILNDADALVNSQLLKTETFKELLNCFGQEDDWALIMQMLISAETLSRLAPADPSLASIGQVFKRVFQDYGFGVRGDENLLEQMARERTLKALVGQNDGEVIAAGLEAFERRAANGANMAGLAVFLRDPVYAAVVKAGSQEQQLPLVERMARTNSYEERLRLASNLVLSEDRRVLTRVVENLNKTGFQIPVLQALVATNTLLELGRDGIVSIKS